LDSTRKLVKVHDLGNQFQVIDTCADRDVALMGVNQARKRLARALTPRRFPEKIVILGKQDPP
jgi:hypothetical protein